MEGFEVKNPLYLAVRFDSLNHPILFIDYSRDMLISQITSCHSCSGEDVRKETAVYEWDWELNTKRLVSWNNKT